MNGVLDLLKVLYVKFRDLIYIQTGHNVVFEVLGVTIGFRVTISYLELSQFWSEAIHQVLCEMLVIAILIMNTKRSKFSQIFETFVESLKLFC